MPYEFEALVGHLYVVGGRSISTTPPGTLCEVAPKKAARGRETDTIFVVVTPSGDTLAPVAFYEQMAQLAAQRYFASTGSVTSGLRDVFEHINKNLYDHNQKTAKPYEANLLCAVLRGSDLLVGRMGCIATIVQSSGITTSFPEDLTDDDALYTQPLGVETTPTIKMAQFTINNGTRVIFGDSNVAELGIERIRVSLMSMDIATVLAGIKEAARLQLSALIAEFVPPETPSETDIPQAESTTDVLKSRNITPRDEAKSNTEPKRERQPGILNIFWRRVKRILGKVALSIANVLKAFTRMINHFFNPQDEENRRWLSSPLGLGTITLFPFAVVILVVILWLSGTDTSAFEICIETVNERVDIARSPSIVNSDYDQITNAWQIVLTKVEECEAMRQGDPSLAAIRQEGQQVIDNLQKITRLTATPIASMDQAALSRIVMQGRNILVLDEQNMQVYWLTLADDGLSINRSPSPLAMRRGGSVSGITVGDIVDIAITDQFVALDSNGLLIECDVFYQCSAQRLITDDWVDPVAMTFWSGNLYILDAYSGSPEIWRYESSGGRYVNRPSEYFSGNNSPILQDVNDLEIEGGNIYILTDSGQIVKYRSGSVQGFEYVAFPPGQTINSAMSMYMDDTDTAQNLYIINQNRRTIYKTSFAGRFYDSYRITNEEYFNLLQGVVVDSTSGQNLMYAISGNTVFVMPMGE